MFVIAESCRPLHFYYFLSIQLPLPRRRLGLRLGVRREQLDAVLREVCDEHATSRVDGQVDGRALLADRKLCRLSTFDIHFNHLCTPTNDDCHCRRNRQESGRAGVTAKYYPPLTEVTSWVTG